LADGNLDGRIDPAKNFRGGFGAGENCAFADDDSRDCRLILIDKKIGRDVSRADVFAQGDIDWVDNL
jgi:hypothetical protein